MKRNGNAYENGFSQVADRRLGLVGKKIVVTRAPHQAGEMVALLQEYGSEAVVYPCIAIAPPEDLRPLDEALQAAAQGRFDWLVITSANTAMILADRLKALGLSLNALPVATVGPKTADAVREGLRLDVAVVAEKHLAEGLAEALQPVAGQRVLLPQSEIARPALADMFRVAGAEVTVLNAYRTIIGQGGDPVPQLLADGRIDAITFTSSSTVRNFLQRLEGEGGRRSDLEGVCLAAIGPIAAQTMQDNQLPVAVMPDEYTLPALIATLETYFAGSRDE